MSKKESISFENALESALSIAEVASGVETVMLNEVLGRVLAEDIVCQKNLPSFDNSAMDGFAFCYREGSRKLKIADTILAGDKVEAKLQENSCYRIMTGAQVPSDADTIIAIEDCIKVTDDYIEIPDGIKKGNALRKRGEEQQRGTTLMKRGEVMTFAHIAMLSAQGVVALKVYTELKIAIVSTGDEIREPWQSANEDEIYNANAFGISALLKRYGFNSHYIGESFISNGLNSIFHGVNVKPGHPIMMGTMGSCFVMAMPGNPLATMLNLLLLSIPILKKLQGATSYKHQSVYAEAAQPLRLKPNRTNLVLGKMIEGVFHITRDNRIGSGMLTPLMESNAVVIFGEDVSSVDRGDIVKVIQF